MSGVDLHENRPARGGRVRRLGRVAADTAAVTAAVLLAATACAAVPIQPRDMTAVRASAFVGDISQQVFVELRGTLQPAGSGDAEEFRCRLTDKQGRPRRVEMRAWCRQTRRGLRWRYAIANDERDLTVCRVVFPIVRGVRMADDRSRERIVWPSLYQGALIDGLASRRAFEQQAAEACKGHRYLYGLYQGDLSLPFFVHLGDRGSFGIMVLDPTHEVIALEGLYTDQGMNYQVTTFPKIPAGGEWKFGDIEAFYDPVADWHRHADYYRQWLISQGMARPGPPRTDVACFVYGRWDGLLTDEVVRWCRKLDARDVLLWVQLFGRGDRYYPCYFPPPSVGVKGMTAKLARLRAAGLRPYFYTNYYLISPLQTRADAQAWTKRYPQKYPAWLARSDGGYAETVKQFQSSGHEFGGPWLWQKGGILPLRVRRLSFQWGEYPVFFWHMRPFYAACVATEHWRKLFRDVVKLHTQMGAVGIFMDQVAAMYPELCSATGHGHDRDSFGMWNRAVLELLREVRATGEQRVPDFFIETEGAADLDAKYVDRFLCSFGPLPKRAFPELLRYTVPWAQADVGSISVKSAADAQRVLAQIRRTLLLGGAFRVAGGGPTGPFDPNSPAIDAPGISLLRAAIRARRRLRPLFDGGRFMDRVGLRWQGRLTATWFRAPAGVLVVCIAEDEGASVDLRRPPPVDASRAWALDWHSDRRQKATAVLEGDTLHIRALRKGLNLVVVPARGR